jgi:hydroxymethylpyrimidine/phosphomethylpyrimidine kinase
MRAAAKSVHKRFGCAALVKGGHLANPKQAVDVFHDERQELLLSAPYVRGIHTHGIGCTYSAAIVGYLSRGLSLINAVKKAKGYITGAITHCNRARRHFVLGNPDQG